MARREEFFDDEQIDVRSGRVSAKDFIEQFEEEEGTPSGRKKGGGGGQRKEPFGHGKRAQKKRRKVMVRHSQERRKGELEEELLSTLPSNPEGLAGYRAWLERVLGGGRLTLDYEIEEWPIAGSGPGGQHRNRKRTSIRMEHKPTGLTAENQGRSQTASRRGAQRSLEEKLNELADKWRLYTESHGGKVEDLLPMED